MLYWIGTCQKFEADFILKLLAKRRQFNVRLVL